MKRSPEKTFPSPTEPITHWNSDIILRLLAQRHSEDLFVPECKDGPTQGVSEHYKMDAWAMHRSWANSCFTGYEIKVARGDFLRDEKWRVYLNYCNQFYFVCPPGLIQPDELPPEAGLIYVSATGTKLFTKKKAMHRTVTIPETVWMYVLMCRVKVKSNSWDREPQDNREKWRQWLEQKAEDQKLGDAASRGLQRCAERQIDAVKTENKILISRMSEYDKIISYLSSIGIDQEYTTQWRVQERIEELREIVPPKLMRGLQRTKDDLESVIESLKKLGERPAEVA